MFYFKKTMENITEYTRNQVPRNEMCDTVLCDVVSRSMAINYGLKWFFFLFKAFFDLYKLFKKYLNQYSDALKQKLSSLVCDVARRDVSWRDGGIWAGVGMEMGEWCLGGGAEFVNL